MGTRGPPLHPEAADTWLKRILFPNEEDEDEEDEEPTPHAQPSGSRQA